MWFIGYVASCFYLISLYGFDAVPTIVWSNNRVSAYVSITGPMQIVHIHRVKWRHISVVTVWSPFCGQVGATLSYCV